MPDATDIPTLRRLLHEKRRIAVVGISAEWHCPSFFVGKYLLEHGYTMIPINPKSRELPGQRCYADLPSAARETGPIDMVDCFRKADDMDRCVKIEHGRLFGGLNWAGVSTRVISARRPRQLPY